MTALGPAFHRKLIVALAKRQFEQCTGEEVRQWAAEVLQTHDSPTLRMLARLTPPWNEIEVDSYLARTAAELGFQIPSSDELLPLYSRIIAEDIVHGRTAPLDGCQKLCRLYTALCHP